jgi:hypothetical protein
MRRTAAPRWRLRRSGASTGTLLLERPFSIDALSRRVREALER